MPFTIKLNGRTYQEGDRVTLNSLAQQECNASQGTEVIILRRQTNEIDGGILIGLYSDSPISGWHNLDGAISGNHGWWIPKNRLAKCIVVEDEVIYKVNKKLNNRGIELKGKTCKILGQLEDASIFVEFEENVNGCSADGLGKAGYCVALSPGYLTSKKRKKSAKQS